MSAKKITTPEAGDAITKHTAPGHSMRDPRPLVPSPRLAGIWMLNTIDSEEARANYAAGAASVLALKEVQVPIDVIVGTNEIVDGRHRHEWALAAGLTEVPVNEVTPEQGQIIIERELFARRAMTQGQKAWAKLCVCPELAAGKSGPKSKVAAASSAATDPDSCGDRTNSPATLTEVAAAIGVGERTLKAAAAIQRLFREDKRFTKGSAKAPAEAARKAVEHRIWQGEGLESIYDTIKPGIPQKAADAAASEPGTTDPADATDAEALLAGNKYTQLLLDIGTEVETLRTFAHLTNAALHETASKLLTSTGTLTIAEMERRDIPSAQKQQLVSHLRDLLTRATEAAKAHGVTLK